MIEEDIFETARELPAESPPGSPSRQSGHLPGVIEGNTVEIARGLQGKTVVIKDCAYKTWEALIYYLYTDQIVFAPLSRDGLDNRSRPAFMASLQNDQSSHPCSAKSIYRLADKMYLPELQRRAFNHIKGQMSEKTILRENFSKFASRYPEIQKMEMTILARHFNILKTDAFYYHIGEVMRNDPSRGDQIMRSLLRDLMSVQH